MSIQALEPTSPEARSSSSGGIIGGGFSSSSRTDKNPSSSSFTDSNKHVEEAKQPKFSSPRQIDSSSTHVENEPDNTNALKEWLLQKSRESLKFAHLMFWCILSSLDDAESMQMSQHRNKEVWDVLR